MSTEPPETASAAEKIILRWDSSASEETRDKMICSGDRHEIGRYLDAVDELQKSMSDATLSDSPSSSALEIAMARLEDEFRTILLSYTSPIEAELTHPDFELKDYRSFEKKLDSNSSCYTSTSSTREVDLIPDDAVYHLRCIAERMIAAGYMIECVRVYASVRKSVVDLILERLNVEKLSVSDFQKLEWVTLGKKIPGWIQAARICIRELFPSERRLCEQIFQGLGTSTNEACFMETIKGPAIQLFNFAEAISISKQSSEKLFHSLDMHEALSDLWPDIESVFESRSSESIRVHAVEILSRLAEAVRGILSEFESLVLHTSSKPVPGGSIHPLARYVMNYICLFPNYTQTLIEIVSKPSTGPKYSSDPNVPDMDFSEFEGQASIVALHLIWTIVILQFKLDVISKLYKDTSLAHLFMMNNVHYIVQKIEGSPELREMIGDEYLRKTKRKLRIFATDYHRATWVRVLYCLRDGDLHESALRERLNTFNSMFEEVHRTQARWLIPDPQLREELRISILEKVIPAYRSFIGRFTSHIESENYIKYSVEDLEDAILDFFEGHSVTGI